MRAAARRLVIIAAFLCAGRSDAGAEQYLGRVVADVRVEVAGQAVEDPAVVELIETAVGEPLTMSDVRATIDHLVGLGRFEDVRVFASPSDQGVIVRWQLTPVRRIRDVEVTGQPQLPEQSIRDVLIDRFGSMPSADRVPEMVTTLEAFYADRGFRSAAILPRIVTADPAPERARLVLSITAGSRAGVGRVTVIGRPLGPEAQLLRELQLQPGRPFDRIALDDRIADYEEDMRGQGHYEGRVRQSHEFSSDGRTVDVTLEVEPGPRVRLVFDGDPLPDENSRTLVPIREERSVDEDLLEDASRRIEDALRQEGYRAAQAIYARRQQGAELVLTFTVTRGPLHRVDAVNVTGMTGLTDADIAPILQIEPGEPFIEARVGAVAAALTELYRVRGFSQAAVKPVIQVLPPNEDDDVIFRPVDVRFEIQEGPQTIVSAVRFEGTTSIGPQQLAAAMALAAGRPFYRPQLAADRDALERAYRNLGFQSVSVISQLAFADEQRRVAVTWTVREGEQIRVDRVLISGNVRTSPDVIRRELVIRPGSPMSDDGLIDSQRQLAATGLFRRVRVTELPRSGSTARDVLVEIEEAPATTVSYGGGLEVGRFLRTSEDGGPAEERLDVAPRGFFDISRRNLWGKNRSATLFGRVTMRSRRPAIDTADASDTGGYGLNDYRGFFSFREPRAFGTAGDGQFTAFVEQGIRTSFDFNRKGVTADYARRFTHFTATGRYTFDHTKLFDEKIAAEDQLLIDRLFPQVKLSKFFGSILRDSRDDVLDPQRGSVLGVDGSVAAKLLGSEVGFVKTFAQAFVYRRLPGRGYVLAAGARLGLALGFAQEVPPVFEIAAHDDFLPAFAATAIATTIRELPASERFFAGGDTTVRGFALDRLGTAETLDPQGFPQGGNGMAVFNLEARAPYWKNLQFVWFADAGNVFSRASEIRLDELRLTSGVGFRYRSPIGPLRVDWGFKLNTRLLLSGARERGNVFHISLGQAF
jgi:outer membrane protein insertion porin family